MSTASKKMLKLFLLLPLVGQFFSISIAKADYTCAILNDPAQTKDLIVTVIEEAIGSPTTATSIQGDTTVMNCFRKTDCTMVDKNGEPVQQCTPTYESECTAGAATICQRVQVYIAKSGAGLLYAYIGQIYRWAALIIGSVCVLFMVIGGIEIATAGDNSENINKAKERIIQSIAGLVLLFMSAAILYTINPNFFTIS